VRGGASLRGEIARLRGEAEALREEADREGRHRTRRQKARRRLLPFVKYVRDGYRANWHHKALAARLDRWVRTPGDRLLVCMPPQHGKSELISRHLPALILGQQPDAPVMLCSYNAGLAGKLNRHCRKVVGGDRYRELFPGTLVPRIGRDEGVRTGDYWEVVGHNGSLRSSGVKGGIAGHPFLYGIVDDPLKGRDASESVAIREACWEWWTGDFYTRRAPGARMLVVATRWHEEDLPGMLLRMMQDDPRADRWDTLILPAMKGPDGKPYDPRKEGEALWPERYPLSDLEKVRAQSESDWWSLYQQDPRRGARTEWAPDYFEAERIYFADWPYLAVKGMSVDPSKGATDKPGDFCAITKGGYDGMGGTWAEAELERLSPEAIVKRTVQIAKEWEPDIIAIETNMFQQLFVADMVKEAAKEGIPFPVLEIENYVPKNVRIRRLGGYLASGQIHVRKTPGGERLVSQLRQFPLATNDDGPDGLEMLQRALMTVWNDE
jgi:predicted phage terminase large subunit-like protein